MAGNEINIGEIVGGVGHAAAFSASLRLL